MAVNLSYPKPRSSQVKMAAFVGNTTAAQELMWLPKDAVIAGVYLIGAANATAAATDTTVSVAGNATATGVVNAYNLETGGAGYNAVGAAAGSLVGTKLTADTVVKATLSAAVAGDAALSWTLKVEYFVSAPGETI